MDYNKKIEKLENQFIGANFKLQCNLLSWRPAYDEKIKENLEHLKNMVEALISINDDFEKQSKKK